MNIKERYTHIFNWFQVNIPSPKTELKYNNTFELLIAVILSAQCTDVRVNMVTPALFHAFPTPEALSVANVDNVYGYIRSISYPNNKAKSLIGMAKMLVSEYESIVPNSMEELIKLPGVGRKTANVILIVAYDIPAMPVDTHVFRVANRLGLTNNSKTPENTEKILVKYIPQKLLSKAHHWLILHGRYICKAQNPSCIDCGLKEWCKYFESK